MVHFLDPATSKVDDVKHEPVSSSSHLSSLLFRVFAVDYVVVAVDDALKVVVVEDGLWLDPSEENTIRRSQPYIRWSERKRMCVCA